MLAARHNADYLIIIGPDQASARAHTAYVRSSGMYECVCVCMYVCVGQM